MLDQQTVCTEPRTILAVPTYDASGQEYTYSLEPELQGTTNPRTITLAPCIHIARLIFGCISLAILVVLVYGLFNNSGDGPISFVSWNALQIGVYLGLTLIFRSDDSDDPALLRSGVVTQARVVSGKVDDDEGICYSLKYIYRIRFRTLENRISVTAEQYDKYTRGNPYITVFYNPNKPELSRPYFKITTARLSS